MKRRRTLLINRRFTTSVYKRRRTVPMKRRRTLLIDMRFITSVYRRKRTLPITFRGAHLSWAISICMASPWVRVYTGVIDIYIYIEYIHKIQQGKVNKFEFSQFSKLILSFLVRERIKIVHNNE